MAAQFRAILQPPAIAFLDSIQDRADLDKLEWLIGHICLDPWINNTTKIALQHPPVVYAVMVQEGYWITYHHQDNQTLHIDNIQRAARGSRPRPR